LTSLPPVQTAAPLVVARKSVIIEKGLESRSPGEDGMFKFLDFFRNARSAECSFAGSPDFHYESARFKQLLPGNNGTLEINEGAGGAQAVDQPALRRVDGA
jgi:hypothetical protein